VYLLDQTEKQTILNNNLTLWISGRFFTNYPRMNNLI
jgi:hypothetical protein